MGVGMHAGNGASVGLENRVLRGVQPFLGLWVGISGALLGLSRFVENTGNTWYLSPGEREEGYCLDVGEAIASPTSNWNPAATYSPGPSPAKYHQRVEA